jgi:putative heme-binding domain-containing protein
MRVRTAVSLGLSLVLMICSAQAEPTAAQRAKDALIVRTLLRLSNVDLADKPDAKAALLRYLEGQRGTDKYVELAEKFNLRETKNDLLQLALDKSDSSLGVSAAGLLIKFGEHDLLRQAVANPDDALAAKAVSVIGLVADPKTNDLFQPLVTDTQRSVQVRSAAVTALGRNGPGQKWLLDIVEQGKLPADLKFAAANALLSSSDDLVRTAAAKHLALPATADAKPLPPLSALVKMTGDAARGRELFKTTATCAKCHKVLGEGKDVGPDLSEIGSKLSREAMFVSILDPNAGINFNYETYLVRTLEGTVFSGILVSQTDEEIDLKTAEAIVHKLKRNDVEQMKKQPTSLMPADLQKQLRVQDLVDVVEYLTTLKKPN